MLLQLSFFLLCVSTTNAALPPGLCSFFNKTHGSPLYIALTSPMNFSIHGSSATIGQRFSVGVAAAVLESNAVHGPFCGSHNLSFTPVDMSFQSIDSVILKTQHVLDEYSPLAFVGTLGGDSAIAQLPVLKQKGVISVGPITGSDKLRKPFDPYVVHMRPSYSDELAALVNYFVDALGMFRIGLIRDNTEFGIGVLTALAAILRERRLPIYVEGILDAASPNAATTIESMELYLQTNRLPQPQVVVVAGIESLSFMAIQAAHQHWQNLYFATPSLVSLNNYYVVFENNPDLYTRIYSVSVLPDVANSNIPIVASFYNALQRLEGTSYVNYFGGLEPEYFSFEGYIVTRLWIEMLKIAEKESVLRASRNEPAPPITTEFILDLFYKQGIIDLDNFRLGPYGGQCESVETGCQCNQGLRRMEVVTLLRSVPLPVAVSGGDFRFHSCGYNPKETKIIYFGQSVSIDPVAQPLAYMYGLSLRIGVLAAFAETNKLGGVQGLELGLISYNDNFNPQIAYNNTLKLITQDRVFGLVGYLGTPSSLASLPLIFKHGVPYIGAFTGTIRLRKPFDPHVINTRASYEDEIASLLRVFVDQQGLSRIAIIYQNDEFGNTARNALEVTLKVRLIPILASAEFSIGLKNHIEALYSMITQVEERNVGDPQVLLIVSSTGDAVPITIEAQKIWPHVRVAIGSYVDFGALSNALRGLSAAAVANGQPAIKFDRFIWATMVFPSLKPDDDSNFGRNMRNALKLVNDSLTSTLGETMPISNPVLVEGYIAGRLTVLALERMSKATTPDQFIEAVYNTGVFPIDDFVRLGPYAPNCTGSGCQCNQGMRNVYMSTTDNLGNIINLPQYSVQFDTCGFVDQFNPSPCRDSFWNYSVSACNPNTLQRTVEYAWNYPHPWDSKLSFECQGGSSLPENIVYFCEYIPDSTSVSTFVYVIAAIAIATLSFLGAAVIYNRKTRVMVNSQWRFLILMLFGGVIAFASDFVRFGKPNALNCMYYPLIRRGGMALFFSSLYARTARIRRIFDNTKLRKVSIKDIELFVTVLQIMVIAVGLLIAYAFVDSPKPKLDGKEEMIFGSVPHMSCKSESYVIEVAFSAMLIYLVGMSGYNAYRIRKAPEEFQESKYLALASYNIAVCTLFAIPFSASGTADIRVVTTVESVLYFVGIGFSLVILIVPKFFVLDSSVLPYTKNETTGSNEPVQTQPYNGRASMAVAQTNQPIKNSNIPEKTSG